MVVIIIVILGVMKLCVGVYFRGESGAIFLFCFDFSPTVFWGKCSGNMSYKILAPQA